ncbi:MAG: lipopolysaccharide biosynthesis protein [Acidocella sp.]|nr:lipopolysaccharide biosynthesis protein [Acidocella sp.]
MTDGHEDDRGVVIGVDLPGSKPAAPVRSLGVRAISGAMWITIEMVSVQGLSLVVFSILAHLLNPKDFGYVAISFTFIYSLKSLTIDQIVTPMMRKLKATHEEWTTAFWISFALGIGCALILCGISFLADRLFHADGLGRVIRPMSLILIALSLSRTQEAWLMRNFQMRVLAIRSVIGMLIGAVAGVGAALLGLGVWSLVIQQCVGSFSGLAMLWLITPWRPGLRVSLATTREILVYLRAISGNAALGVLNQNADTALVALIFGPVAVGIYSIGKRLKLALQMVATGPVNGVAMPALSESQDNTARLQRVFLTATRLVFTCCAPIFLGAAAVASPIIVLLFGARWAGASGVFAWLSVGALCSLAFDYFGAVLLLHNRPAWLTALTAIQTGLSIILFALMHIFGPRIIAAPFVLPYIVTVPFCAVLALRLINLRVRQWLRAVTPPVFAALVMVAGIFWLSAALPEMSIIERLAVLCGAGGLLYAATMAVVARDTLASTVNIIRHRRLKPG